MAGDPRTFKQSKVYAWIQVAQLNDTSDDGGGGAGTGISNSRTSITVDAAGLTPGSSHHIENGMDLLIESEQVTVSGVDGNTITIDRAEYGTSAAAHLDNTPIFAYKELKDATSGASLVQSILIKDDMYYPRMAQLVVSNPPTGDNYSLGVFDDILKNNTPIKIIDGANFSIHFTGTITSFTKQHGMQAGNTIQFTAEDALYELSRSKLQGADRTITLKDNNGAQTNADFSSVALSKKTSAYIEKLIQRFQFKGIPGSENNLTTTETSSGSYTRFETSSVDQKMNARRHQITFASTDSTVLKAIQRLALRDRISDTGHFYGYIFYADPNVTSPSSAHKPAQMFNYFRSSFMPGTTDTTKDTAPSGATNSTGNLDFKYPTSSAITENGHTILMQPGASFDKMESERVNTIVVRLRDTETGKIDEVQFEVFNYTEVVQASQGLTTAYTNKKLIGKIDDTTGVEDPLRQEDDAATDWDARLVLDGAGSDEPLVGYLQYLSSTPSSSNGTYSADGTALISSTRTDDADALVSPGDRLYLNKVSEGNYLTLTSEEDPDAIDIYRPQQVHEQKRAVTMDFGVDDNPDNIRTAVAARFAQFNTPKQRGRFQCKFMPYYSFETQVGSGEIATAAVGSKTKITFTDDHSSLTTSRDGDQISTNGQLGLRAGHVIAKLTGQDGTVDTFGYLEKVTDTTAVAIMNSGSITTNDHIRYYVPLRTGHIIAADAAHYGVSSANGSGQQIVTSMTYYENGGQAYTDIETLAVPSASTQTVISAIKPDFLSVDDQNDDDKDGDKEGFEFTVPHFTGTFTAGSSGTTRENVSLRYSAGNLYIGSEVFHITAGTSENSDGVVDITDPSDPNNGGSFVPTDTDEDGFPDKIYIIYFEPEHSTTQFQIKSQATFEDRNGGDGLTAGGDRFISSRTRTKLGIAYASVASGGKASWFFTNMTTGLGSSDETDTTTRTAHSPDLKIGGAQLTGVGPDSHFFPPKTNTHSLGLSGTHIFTALFANSSSVTTSDGRDKKDVQDIQEGLDFVNDLRPVKYKWKEDVIDDTQTHRGVIAQEVIEVLKKYNITDLDDFAPIHQSPNGKLGARYEQFVPILIKAIQELSSKVNKLENEGKE